MNKVIHLKKQNQKTDIIMVLILIFSVLGFALIPIFPPHIDNSKYSSISPQKDIILKSISTSIMEKTGFFNTVLLLNEYTKTLQAVEQYVDISYVFEGIGAAILILLIYLHMTSKEQELIENSKKELYPSDIWKIVGFKKINQDKFEGIRTKILILIPTIFIVLAEILIFTGITRFGIWIHIGVLIAFTLSHMFVKDLKVYRIYQALMLLPIIRLVNFSMPIFYTTTIYTFAFVYAPILLSIVIIIMDQPDFLTKNNITIKNATSCIIPSIYMGLIFGIREYMTMRPSSLIPDLSFENLLKLTLIMVFFVGLTEELIFRSLLQTRLEEVIGIKETLILTSILFGAMHSVYGNFYECLCLYFEGIIIGYIFYKTRSLPLVTLLHGLTNVFLFSVFPLYMSNWMWC